MDFVKINYSGKIKDGKIFDTTDEALAKKEEIFDEGRVYKPLSVAVGEGQVIKALDEELAKMKVGDKKTVVCEPAKAYGEKSTANIRLIPIKVFKKEKVNPFPGMPVEIDGMRGKVQTVSGGRVRVDFNHELAGKTLEFDVEVVDKATTDKAKIGYIIERNFESQEGFEIKLDAKKLALTLPQKSLHDKNLLVRKASLCAECFRILELSDVTFEEKWENPKNKAEKAKKEEKGSKAKKEEKK